MSAPELDFTNRPQPVLSCLPQKAALLVLRLGKALTLSRQLRPHSCLLLALSGGADSTALTCLLFLLQKRLGISLCALTCNHNLRQSAADEVHYVQALCKWLDIPLHTRSLPVEASAKAAGCGLEEAGRRLRYAALEEERVLAGADWIVTGHHSHDLTEDILMRLLRGSGWPGLGGMHREDPERHLLRPLLDTAPEELRSFLSSLDLAFCEDESNKDTSYTRNRIRQLILPLLRRENPALDKTLGRLAKLARLDDAFFSETLEQAAQKARWTACPENNGHCVELPAHLLAHLPASLRLRLYLRIIQALTAQYGGQARADTLFALDEALTRGGRRRFFELSEQIGIELSHGSITIYGGSQRFRPGGNPESMAR